MADRVLNVKVKMAGAVKAQQSLTKIEKGGKKVGGAFASMKKNWAGLVVGFAAAAMAMRGVINFFKGCVAAANEQEMAINQLNAAMRANSDYTAEASQAVQDYAASLQKQTTYGDEALIQVSATIKAVAKLGNESLPTATKATLQIAQMFKMNLTSAALLVGKTLTGTTNAFQRYGLEIDMTGDKQARLNELLEKTSAGWEMATAETETQAGKIKQLKNAWGDFTETLGGFITKSDGVTTATDDITKGIEKLDAFLKKPSVKGVIANWIGYQAFQFRISTELICGDTTTIIKAWENMRLVAARLVPDIVREFDNLKVDLAVIWDSIRISADRIWTDIRETIVGQVRQTYNQVANYFRRMKNAAAEWGLGFVGGGVGAMDPIPVSGLETIRPRARFVRTPESRRAMAGGGRPMTGSISVMGYRSVGGPNQLGLGFANLMARSYRGGSPMAALGTSVSGMVSGQVKGMVERAFGDEDTAKMFGASIGAFGGPVGSILGSLIGSLVGGLFGKKKRMQVTEAIAVKDMQMRDLLSQLLNVTKSQLNRRGAGGLDRLNNLRLAQQVVG